MNTFTQPVARLILLSSIAIIATMPTWAQTLPTAVPSPSTPPSHHLYLHGFRSPSQGLEYRTGRLGFHAGRYITILDQTDSRGGRDTVFAKLGISWYSAEATRSQEFFGGISLVYGLNRNYRSDLGGFAEVGVRRRITGGLDARLGAGLLLVPAHPVRLNPTVGLSYRFRLQ